jgi:Aldehyde dehydrogenase family
MTMGCSAPCPRPARKLRAGVTFYNNHNAPAVDERAPFGGFNQSGIGRELGSEGLLAFTETHVVSVPSTALAHQVPRCCSSAASKPRHQSACRRWKTESGKPCLAAWSWGIASHPICSTVTRVSSPTGSKRTCTSVS